MNIKQYRQKIAEIIDYHAFVGGKSDDPITEAYRNKLRRDALDKANKIIIFVENLRRNDLND